MLAATSHIDHSFGLPPADLAPGLEAVRGRLAEEGIPLEVVPAVRSRSPGARARRRGPDGAALGGGPTLLVERP